MGVSYVQRDGTHIRMDMLVSAFKGRVLWLFELLSVLMILVLMMALTWGAWEHFDRSFDCARPCVAVTAPLISAFRSGPRSLLFLWPLRCCVYGCCCRRLAMAAL